MLWWQTTILLGLGDLGTGLWLALKLRCLVGVLLKVIEILVKVHGLL